MLSLFGINQDVYFQGQLADYNLLVDKLNTDTDRADVEMECRDLKLENDQLGQEVEQLWAEKQLKEQQIQQLELELEQERHMADNVVAAMQPDLRLTIVSILRI